MNHHWFIFYLILLTYFATMGLIMFVGLNYFRTRNAKKMIFFFLTMRGVKITATLGCLYLYYLFINIEMVKVVLITSGCYLFTLILETLLLYRFEKKRSKNG